jgi:hypothetical protein
MKPAANKDDVIDTLIEKIHDCYTMARLLKSIPAPTIPAPVVPVAHAARAAPAARFTRTRAAAPAAPAAPAPARTLAALAPTPAALAAPAAPAPAAPAPARTLAALAPTPAALAALAAATPAPAPAPASSKSATPDKGLEGLVILSNDINTVNDYIGNLLKSDGNNYTEYREVASKDYYYSVGDKEIRLECMWASGNNLDCFVHSFLTAVFPAFRNAVALEFDKKTKPREFEKFATIFRKKAILLIVNYSHEKGVRSGNLEDIRKDLLSDRTQLADDLIPYLCYYYNIRILLFGQPSTTNGLPTSRLIGNKGNIYAISNPGAGHFEPCRIQYTTRYILTEEESNGFTSKYKGTEVEKDSEFTRRQQLIYGIDEVKNRKKPTNPGQLTELYQKDDTVVRFGEGIYDNLTKLIIKYQGSGKNDIRDSLREKREEVRDIEISYVLGEIKEDEAMAGLATINTLIDDIIKTTTNPTSVAEAPVPAGPGEWECHRCTYVNKDSDKKCAMCEEPRRKKGGKRRVRTHRKKHRTGFRKISSQNRRR